MDSLKFLLFVAVVACAVKVSFQGPNQQRLYKDLMIRYNRLVRPVAEDSQTLTVQVGVNLMQILDVDEKQQVLTTNLWLHMLWEDHYLQWNESDYPGVADVRFPDHLIWKPDILLYNSADPSFDGTFKTNILVKPSGSCVYVPPGIFKSTCHIDVRWFPFDTQKCELKFGSWTYNGLAVDLKMMEADISGFTANGEWDLVEMPGKKTNRVYECCEEAYPDVTFTLVMRRRTLYYALNLLLPCVLISILALLVFLLPADSGEKISLGITVLLSLTVFMLLVADIMPATSDSVPLIAQYFATTMIIVGLSIIATVFVLQYHHHDPNGSKMPKWIHIFLLNWCAWFLRMKRPGEERVRPACHSAEHNVNAPIYSASMGLENIHCPTAATSPDSGVHYGRLVGSASEDEALLLKGQNSSVANVEPELAKILDEVRYITKRFRDRDENESICSEWKFAAAVIDRLCLVAFLVITILCTIGILMSAPNFVEAISKDAFSSKLDQA